MRLVVFPLVHVFDPRLVGHERRCPDLAVRMRIRATHYGAFIFEYLHPIIFDAQLGALFDPSEFLTKDVNNCVLFIFPSLVLVNDGFDFFYAHQWNG